MNNSAYSRSFFPVFLQNLKDRLAGNAMRANARMGRVHAPEGAGKLIWVRAGSSFLSQKLAGQLVGALRAKRLDVRIVLTFEVEHEEAFKHELNGLEKVALGYGPCDRFSAINRFLTRMQPLGVLLVGEEPGDNLLQVLSDDRTIQTLLVHTDKLTKLNVAAQYPFWGQSVDGFTTQPACELLSLLVQNQLEPTLRNMVHGSAEKAGFFWLHTRAESISELLVQWKKHVLSQQYSLMISIEGDDAFSLQSRQVDFDYDVQLSNWDREAVSPGTVFWLDSWAWVGAVAVSSIGNYLQSWNRWVYWQALAASQPMLTGFEPLASQADECLCTEDFEEVLQYWQQWQDSDVSTRALTDRNRRIFWEARRQTNDALEILLQQVYDW